MAIAKDASSPATAFTVQGSAAASWTTAAFSPPANSLVGVLANVGYGASGAGSPACTVKDGNNVTYTAGPAVWDTVFAYSGIFWHFYASAPGSITIVVSRTGTTQSGVQILPVVLTGCASTQSGAGSVTNSGSSASATGSVTTTAAGSWVLAAVAVGNSESSFTPNGNTTTLLAFVADTTTDAIATVVGTQASPTGTPGATTFGWTFSPSSSDWSLAALEILPSAGGGTTPSDTEAAHATETAILTASLSTPETAQAIEAASIRASQTTAETARVTEAQSVVTPSAPHDTDAAQAVESRDIAAGPRADTDVAQVTEAAVSPAGTVPRLYSVIRTYAR